MALLGVLADGEAATILAHDIVSTQAVLADPEVPPAVLARAPLPTMLANGLHCTSIVANVISLLVFLRACACSVRPRCARAAPDRPRTAQRPSDSHHVHDGRTPRS